MKMRLVRDALHRRASLVWARLLHPGVQFGRGCVVRKRLTLIQHSSGTIAIGADCVLDSDLTIECSGALEIGARTIFGHHCTLGVTERVTIGEDCMIANLVDIRDHDHKFDRLDIPVWDQGMVSTPITIGRNVWIATKVTVLRGVTIGDNAIVGANAVVTKDIPANAIAVGIPARVVRYRSEAIPETDHA